MLCRATEVNPTCCVASRNLGGTRQAKALRYGASMTPETISLRLDDATYRELEELAAAWRVTPVEAIGMAVHEAYVREQYRRAAAELDEWRNDPAYQAEVADTRAEVEDPRVW